MKPEELKPGYERVFAVTDYHDGPRKGIANYQGEPHFYECLLNKNLTGLEIPILFASQERREIDGLSKPTRASEICNFLRMCERRIRS
jgi:hypothetical protein